MSSVVKHHVVFIECIVLNHTNGLEGIFSSLIISLQYFYVQNASKSLNKCNNNTQNVFLTGLIFAFT